MDLLLENIAKYVSLTKDEQEIVMEYFKIRNYPSKSILLDCGEVCTKYLFVLSGVLRNYTLDDNAIEHTVSFATKGEWITDMRSLVFDTPCNSFIQVLGDARVIVLNRCDQLALFDEVPMMERYFRILVENAVVANQERMLENFSLSAERRYKKFVKRFPNIVEHVSQKDIASYLGVTPEFFSRIKRGRINN